MIRKSVVVMGGGAAGFMAAITCAENSNSEVLLLERHSRFLSKVKISGGGRCNATHNCPEVEEMIKNYPRGGRELRNVFARFGVNETIHWFAKRGVKLVAEADGRMFPESNTSEQVLLCLIESAQKCGVTLQDSVRVERIEKKNDRFEITTNRQRFAADALVVASGGFAKTDQYNFLNLLPHKIVPPVPSLFTFNIADRNLHRLAGVSLTNTAVSIPSIGIKNSGGLLITHWGLSGPAILKTSAWAARKLFEMNYCFELIINWLSESEEKIRTWIELQKVQRKNAHITNCYPTKMPGSLWQFLLESGGVRPEKTMAELGKADTNTLVQQLCYFKARVNGKSTFKEEFVTAGGVNLAEVSMGTMESKLCPGLYFAGEILDIDGVTGGFNFQAAWSTGWLAGKSIAAKMQ